MLEKAGDLSAECARSMMRMCGFRNIAVRNYQEMEKPILLAILQSRLGDFETFLGELNHPRGDPQDRMHGTRPPPPPAT